MKWGVPHFDYKGPFCGMAAFKEHIRFGFWKGALLKDKLPDRAGKMAGAFAHIQSMADLPSAKVLSRMVADAARLNDDGVKVTRAAKAPKPALHDAGRPDGGAQEEQEGPRHLHELRPGRRREYVEWVLDAKQDATRARRIKDAVAWMAEGKIRNWKYAK